MERCPKCKRFGIEKNLFTGEKRCLWNDCLEVVPENKDLSKEKSIPNFVKFRRAISLK